MYNINDRSAAIYEIQRFLLAYSQKNTLFPHLSVDGVYGEQTREAVREFQELNSLPVTGTVDSETYERLYGEYQKIIETEESADSVIDEMKYPLKLGDVGGDVSLLNTVIRELQRYYPELPGENGDFFTRATDTSVRALQGYFLEAVSGPVSTELMKRLRSELSSRQKFNKFK